MATEFSQPTIQTELSKAGLESWKSFQTRRFHRRSPAIVFRTKTTNGLHRIAFNEFRNGNRDVEFPLGTYKMRLQENVRVSLEHVIFEITPPFE